MCNLKKADTFTFIIYLFLIVFCNQKEAMLRIPAKALAKQGHKIAVLDLRIEAANKLNTLNT